MKNSRWSLLLILFALLLIWMLFRGHWADPTSSDNSPSNVTSPAPPASLSTRPTELLPLTDTDQLLIQAARAIIYGRVVDLDGRPVPNAEVACEPNRDPWVPSVRRRVVTSDHQGDFFYEERNASKVSVRASAIGYYPTERCSADLNFVQLDAGSSRALKQRFSPKSNTTSEAPLVLVLRRISQEDRVRLLAKAGALESTQAVDMGMGKAYHFFIQYFYDESESDQGASGTSIAQNEWGVQFSVSSGELIAVNAPEPETRTSFVAPKDGYKDIVEFRYGLSTGELLYTKTLSKLLYARFPDGTFARLKIEIEAGPPRPFYRLTIWHNPSGSTNTEYNPKFEEE